MTSTLALAGMVAAPLQSFAQSPGPAAVPGQDDSNYSGSATSDPPGRVGRLAVMDGTVSTHGSGDDKWSPAVLNNPVSNGDAYWTEPQASAKIEVTGSAVWMADSTEFDIATLSGTALHASEPQGEVYVHLAGLQPGETYTLETPRGTVTMAADGRYDVVAGDTQHPTMITVLDGAAQVTGTSISLQVHANQSASVTGDTSFQGTVGPMVQDDFLAGVLKQETPDQAQAGCPAVVAQMTGGTDLNRYGAWQQNSAYGSVWYPQVGSDWVPYRDGRWSYVAPWGWTWVDNAPWGFAPFHYGRWVQDGGRWGWAPGYAGYGGYAPPVYAPALVSFFGDGGGVGVGIGLGIGLGIGIGANIGWVPLGFGEAYYPGYRVSRGYLSRVNVINIRNVTNIYNLRNERSGFGVDRFANNRGATFVPARVMVNSQPIRGEALRPGDAALAKFRPVTGREPIAPGGRTLGLTPAQAQRMNVRDFEARKAPGPQVAEARGPGERPALRPGAGGPARPAAGAPGPAMMMRGAGPGGLPELRAPGARPEMMMRGPDTRAPTAPATGIDHTGTAGERPALRTPGAAPESRAEPTRTDTPAGREAARPARAEGAPAETHAAAPVREHLAERPAEHAAARPVERPAEHAARPVERPAARQAEHAAPRPAERPHAEAPHAQAPHAQPHAEAPHGPPPHGDDHKH